MKKIVIIIFIIVLPKISIAQFQSFIVEQKGYANESLEKPYSYQVQHQIALSDDSVYVWADDLEYAFRHHKSLNQLTYYFPNETNESYDELGFYFADYPMSTGKVKMTGNKSKILGYEAAEIEMTYKKMRILAWVTNDINSKTTVYPFKNAIRNAGGKYALIFENLPGFVLSYQLFMKNKLYIESKVLKEKVIEELPDFKKYKKSWISLEDIKFGLALLQHDKPMISLGEELPDFKAYLIDGSEYDASDWEGYVKVYDFWGLWCPGCKMEIPILNEVKKQFAGRKVKFIAFGTDDIATLRHYKTLKPFDYEIAYHAAYVANKLGIYAFPQSLVISKKNELIYTKEIPLAEKFLGNERLEIEKQKFIDAIEEALAE
ncbi:TlpA disulfide reductase family protein [Marivirga sp.]|uniref:TlpA family protein disulfide reductase n=1 Tax=Marivirga sp. TaxID=2018662 RepID=UPI002D80216B|nr:TlpA disulfide reductase family protein [Marivirga sp.]HET8861391.1 TlpA disulfide reductase family protein [Marivirga sp.]